MYLDSNLNLDTLFINSPFGDFNNPLSLMEYNNSYYFSSKINNQKLQISKFDKNLNLQKGIIINDSINDKYPSSFTALASNKNYIYYIYNDSVNYLNLWWGGHISNIKI